MGRPEPLAPAPLGTGCSRSLHEPPSALASPRRPRFVPSVLMVLVLILVAVRRVRRACARRTEVPRRPAALALERSLAGGHRPGAGPSRSPSDRRRSALMWRGAAWRSTGAEDHLARLSGPARSFHGRRLVARDESHRHPLHHALLGLDRP